ncbi:UNVERIFIED_CONTAM: hypothetical protein H355_014782 [Colinus virginianus]|nr:hypothetical protein H355_014782 [Colinus virginianus]
MSASEDVSGYGAPGVEFMGLHEENNTVMQIHFIPDQVIVFSVSLALSVAQVACAERDLILEVVLGVCLLNYWCILKLPWGALRQCQLVTLLDDNSLHLWSLKHHSGASELREDHHFTLKGPPG